MPWTEPHEVWRAQVGEGAPVADNTPVNDAHRYPFLSQIGKPADLRTLDESDLPAAADDVRRYLIDSISQCGGHFGAGLGCVELAVALHYVYDTPHDRIVWDVGHQAYPHKILTGRRDLLTTIKQKDGLAPFPKRAESEFDTFGVGHSSTSISAGLGMALASRIENQNRRVVSVIGDGAMTAGMAFEALDHGGHEKPNILVILNENQMSISPNVGALTQMLGRLTAGRFYTGVRERSRRVMKKGSFLRRLVRRWEEHLKGMVMPSTLFEELGWHYSGPIDGHDLPLLVRSLKLLRDLPSTRLLHVITAKGKGYAPAEKDPVKYHAVGPFDPDKGVEKKPSTGGPSYTQVFGDWLLEQAEQDPKLVAITPAMREGSGLVEYAKRYPERYFDVGIAEQHSVTLAAGLACEGLRPVVAIYSTFLQRAYDQLVHDVAVQNLPVMFAIDRAGLVGPDGPTHAGSFDLSYLRCIPNMVIMAPSNEAECRQMLHTGHVYDGPTAVRYPRGKGPNVERTGELEPMTIGESETIRRGHRVAILAFGSVVAAALEAGERLDATVINMRWVKPLDEAAILKAASDHRLIVTVEENAVRGGAGAGINELLAEKSCVVDTLNMGLPDKFQEHGTRDELLEEASLTGDAIERAIQDRQRQNETRASA